MDLALLFFLPLLGGYLFISKLLLTRYRTAREETARVYYHAAVAGVLLRMAGLGVHAFIKAQSTGYLAVAAELHARLLAPLFEQPVEATAGPQAIASARLAADARSLMAVACIWSLVMGLLTPLWNGLLLGARVLVLWLLQPFGWRPQKALVSPTTWLNQRAITDELERLLYSAMVQGEPVQVSLDNDKVYVGLVTGIDPIGPAKHFTLQPMMSGGRTSADRDVIYTSYYDRIIDELQRGNTSRRDEVLQRFGMVVPLARIVTASGFDFDAYKRFALARAPGMLRYRMDSAGNKVLIDPGAAVAKRPAPG